MQAEAAGSSPLLASPLHPGWPHRLCQRRFRQALCHQHPGALLRVAAERAAARAAGTNIPTTTTTTSPTFIAPTPAAAGLAWGDTRLQTPAATWTWNDYNIYNNTFTTPVVQGGVTLSGQSVLPLTNVTGAYPLSGTTFLDLYSC